MSFTGGIVANRPVYQPQDVVRVKGDTQHSSGQVVLADDTYRRALVHWADPEQASAPSQWHDYVDLEKIVNADPQAGSLDPPLAVGLSEAQERRRRRAKGEDVIGFSQIPMYGSHPTISGQPGGQPVGGPNDTMGQRPQQPPNLRAAVPGDAQFLTQQMCASCQHWDPGVDTAALLPTVDGNSDIGMIPGACGLYRVETGAEQVCDSWTGRAGYGLAVVWEESPAMMLDESGTSVRFRKAALKTGVVAAATPDSSGRMVERPLEFVDGRSVRNADGTFAKIGLDDIIDSIRDPAFEKITVPKSHRDLVDENTGYVVGFQKLDDPTRPGEKILELTQEIRDGGIAQKLKDKTIFGSSVGLIFDYVRKTDLKRFPVALKHNALTNVPWLRGLGEHALALSEGADNASLLEVGGIQVHGLPVVHDAGMRWDGIQLADVTEDDRRDMAKSGIALPDGSYPIPNKSFLSKAVQAYGRARDKAAAKRHIIKRARALNATSSLPEGWLGGVSASDDVDTTEGGDRMAGEATATPGVSPEVALQLSEAQSVLKQQQAEIDRLHAQAHRRSVDETVAAWGQTPLKNMPGFLKKARNIMLSDDGGPALVMNLSEEDGGTKELTATEIVTDLVGAMFDEEGKLQLSEQASTISPEHAAETRPPAHGVNLGEELDNSPEAVKQRATEAAAELGLPAGKIPSGGES